MKLKVRSAGSAENNTLKIAHIVPMQQQQRHNTEQQTITYSCCSTEH